MNPIAILHEGSVKKNHDNELLRLLITHLNLDVNQVDFYGVGSKGNFFKEEKNNNYDLLKQRIEEDQIKSVLFVVDADDVTNDAIYGGYENTEQNLNKIIQSLAICKISDIYIVCDPNTKTGYLESLLLATIPNPQRQCIERFLECSEFPSKENHKAILHDIYKRAYPNTPYDFEHAHFNELKDTLNRVFLRANEDLLKK